MNKYISLILEPNEKLLWNGKPQLKALLLFSFLVIIGFLGVSTLLFINSDNTDAIINGFKVSSIDYSSPINILCIAFSLLAFLTPFFMCVFYEITEYGITNKRILIKTGLIGANVRSIYFNQIKSSFINVGVLDRISGSGTILIDTGCVKPCKKEGNKTVYSRFLFLKAPYQVYRLLQDCLPSSKEKIYLEELYFKSNLDSYQGISPEIGKMKPVI